VLEKELESPDAEATSEPQGLGLSTFPRRTRDLFHYLITTFQSMLPAEKAAQFAIIAQELERSILDNCQSCAVSHRQPDAPLVVPHDPRRSRFLLRLVVGKLSHLFSGDKAILPRSLIEGMDRYLIKAFGAVIYEELNTEADRILYQLNCDNDREMWERIRENKEWQRFVDTIFIRILFRFENFAPGRKTFISILEITMQEQSRFTFKDEHFVSIFESLFHELWEALEHEDQRIRWDFMFGDGTSNRLTAILKHGLARWIKRRSSKLLGSGRVVGR